MNLGLDPVHGKRHEAHALRRIETLDGLHQADVAFLDQIGLGQPIAGITAGDMHHEAQMRHDQTPRGFEITLFVEAEPQLALLLGGQHGNAIDGLNVAIQVMTGRKMTHGLKTGAHADVSIGCSPCVRYDDRHGEGINVPEDTDDPLDC